MMKRLINELFLRMEDHVKLLDSPAMRDAGLEQINSDLKLFLLMAGDLAIQVEDNENPPIEVSEEQAVAMGLIESKDVRPADESADSDDTNRGGMYV